MFREKSWRLWVRQELLPGIRSPAPGRGEQERARPSRGWCSAYTASQGTVDVGTRRGQRRLGSILPQPLPVQDGPLTATVLVFRYVEAISTFQLWQNTACPRDLLLGLGCPHHPALPVLNTDHQNIQKTNKQTLTNKQTNKNTWLLDPDAGMLP